MSNERACTGVDCCKDELDPAGFQQLNGATYLKTVDCCAGVELDRLIPPMQVTPKAVVKGMSRRNLLNIAFKASAAVSLAACAPPTGSPSAVQTTAPAGAPAGSGERPVEAGPPQPNPEKLDLAFCSQVLCVLPFEVARQRGFFAAEGLDVNLTYMRGGTQAMNALVANSVDWVGTGFDVVVQTVAAGKDVMTIASTSRLPFFALAIGPRQNIASIQDLAGKKIGVGNLGTTDHLMAQYLLKKEGVPLDSVEFVAAGPNLYEQLNRGQLEAGMVQEPSLTLLERSGGKILVNFMRLEDSQKWLGGPYQFMGLHTRPEVLQARPETAKKLIRALVKASRWTVASPGSDVVKAAPEELVAGGDVELFAEALDRYKRDLYPTDALLQLDSIQRVIDVQTETEAIRPGSVVATRVFTNDYVQQALASLSLAGVA